MMLVDTSVWIDHLNGSDPHMAELLARGAVLMHPFVLGEIALGKLRKRKPLLKILMQLDTATVATEMDIISAINTFSLDGTGIGYVDVHLLLSAKLDNVKFWTRDKRLAAQAARLGVDYRAMQ